MSKIGFEDKICFRDKIFSRENIFADEISFKTKIFIGPSVPCLFLTLKNTPY